MKMINKIELLMHEAGLNRRQFSIKAGIPYSTVDNWFKVDCEKMQLPTFRVLCDFFGVTMDSMAWDDQEIVYRKDVKMPEITPAERDVIHAFRYLDDDGKGRILNALNYERTQEKERKKVSEAS